MTDPAEHVVAQDRDGSEVLVIRFPNGDYHVARRAEHGDVWGPPLAVVSVEESATDLDAPIPADDLARLAEANRAAGPNATVDARDVCCGDTIEHEGQWWRVEATGQRARQSRADFALADPPPGSTHLVIERQEPDGITGEPDPVREVIWLRPDAPVRRKRAEVAG